MRVIEEIPASSSDSESDSDEDQEVIFSQHELDAVSEGSSDEDESSDQEDEEMDHSAKSKRAKGFSWRKKRFEHQSTAAASVFSAPDELSSPRSYFAQFFDDDLFQLIAEQTNLYSCQLIGASINTTVDEIKSFVGIKLIMGVVRMPSMDDYWAEDTRYAKITNVMSVKRFKCLSRFIHFQDNQTSEPSQDRLCKVTPVLEHVRKKCLEIESENKFSIDEMMVPYKGTKAGSLRQYLPSKPHHWGFKIFVRAGVSGIVYDFLTYTGKSTFGTDQGPAKELGVGANVVIQLCKTIKNPSECVVYFDNFFTSLPLIVHLKESLGLRSLGTIRKNRLKGCTLEDDRALLRQGRGSFDYRVDNEAEVAVVKWSDNKAVTLASSCAAISPLKEVRRFSREERRRVAVPCPNIVSQYNVHMGGVDLADMMVALYRTPARSHRWYLGLFWQMADIAINNGWLLYRRDAKSIGVQKHKKLKEFRLEVADALIHSGKKKGRPSKGGEENVHSPTRCIQRPTTQRPMADVRLDQVDHFPAFTDKGRCRLCPEGQTTIYCTKCGVRLCIVTGKNPRNCFQVFHKK
ncbi:piggyBac transposable element-derived protein 3-like [Centropristis striata]|uniref:piggyBac transposable element-derived protein 3-like n=1 Tax=Centropristis striata TaxID=184440 RepID=UPI0027DFE707|nr:piggyBac transposable element-derived protein 3-like [Centropristis striata]